MNLLIAEIAKTSFCAACGQYDLECEPCDDGIDPGEKYACYDGRHACKRCYKRFEKVNA